MSEDPFDRLAVLLAARTSPETLADMLHEEPTIEPTAPGGFLAGEVPGHYLDMARRKEQARSASVGPDARFTLDRPVISEADAAILREYEQGRATQDRADREAGITIGALPTNGRTIPRLTLERPVISEADAAILREYEQGRATEDRARHAAIVPGREPVPFEPVELRPTFPQTNTELAQQLEDRRMGRLAELQAPKPTPPTTTAKGFGPWRALKRAAAETFRFAKQVKGTLDYGWYEPFLRQEIVDREVAWRKANGGFKSYELVSPQTVPPTEPWGDEELRKNIRWEVHNGLPMMDRTAWERQQQLYAAWHEMQPDELPEARGWWEKIGAFGGNLAPFIVSMELLRRPLQPAGYAAVRGMTRLPLAERAALGEAATSGMAAGATSLLTGQPASQAVSSAGFMASLGIVGRLGAKAGSELLSGSLARFPATAEAVGKTAGEAAWFTGAAASRPDAEWDDILIEGVLGPIIYNAKGLMAPPRYHRPALARLPREHPLRVGIEQHLDYWGRQLHGEALPMDEVRANVRRIDELVTELKTGKRPATGAERDAIDEFYAWHWGIFKDIATGRVRPGGKRAAEEGQEPQGGEREHRGTGEERPSAEAGGAYLPEPSRPEQEEAQEAMQGEGLGGPIIPLAPEPPAGTAAMAARLLGSVGITVDSAESAGGRISVHVASLSPANRWSLKRGGIEVIDQEDGAVILLRDPIDVGRLPTLLRPEEAGPGFVRPKAQAGMAAQRPAPVGRPAAAGVPPEPSVPEAPVPSERPTRTDGTWLWRRGDTVFWNTREGTVYAEVLADEQTGQRHLVRITSASTPAAGEANWRTWVGKSVQLPGNLGDVLDDPGSFAFPKVPLEPPPPASAPSGVQVRPARPASAVYDPTGSAGRPTADLSPDLERAIAQAAPSDVAQFTADYLSGVHGYTGGYVRVVEAEDGSTFPRIVKPGPAPADAPAQLARYQRASGYTPQTSADVLAADRLYGWLVRRAQSFDRAGRGAETRIDVAAERAAARREIDEGRLSLSNLKYAQMHELPEPLRRLLEVEADRLLTTTESEATREALGKIKVGAGQDVGSEVEAQRERIIGILMGTIDQRTIFEKDIGAPQRPPSEVLPLLLKRDRQVRVRLIDEAMDSVTAGKPNDLAREVGGILATPSHEPTADEVNAYLRQLAEPAGPSPLELPTEPKPGTATQEVAPVEPAAPAPVEIQTEEEVAASKALVLANAINGELEPTPGKLVPMDWRKLFALADQAYGGTQAQGVYAAKDAFDAVELAVNLRMLSDPARWDPRVDLATAKANADDLQGLLYALPTQTRRDIETESYQQFSTPPHYAYAVAWLAKLEPADLVLEPSAGNGALAVFARNIGATVIVNELAERRVDNLRALGFPDVRSVNAEHLHAFMPKTHPSVVLMNPPFSQTAGRLGERKVLTTGAAHIDEALKMLIPNGRLVAIVGRGMTEDSPTFKEWFDGLKMRYTLAANVGVSGNLYAKYGTTFGTRVLIIDNTGPQPAGVEPIRAQVISIPELMATLERVRNGRPAVETGLPTAEQSAGLPIRVQGGVPPAVGAGGGGAIEGGGPEAGPQPIGGRPTLGVGHGGGVGPEEGPGLLPVGQGEAPVTAGPGMDVSGAGERGEHRPQGLSQTEAAGGSGRAGGGPAQPVRGDRPELPGGSVSAGGLTVKDKGTRPEVQRQVAITEQERQEKSGTVYERYTPERVKIADAQPHPTPLVQSAAMASVHPPPVNYSPNLPNHLIKKGVLSDAQLEAIVYAGQSFERHLANGQRRGFLIGDGTGVGKGREIAGIILDHWNKGHKKALWVSKNSGLAEDALRDWLALGADKKYFLKQSALPGQGAIARDAQAVLFTTYDTLKAQGKPRGDQLPQARMDQIVNWLGPDFDGVIVFDECHAMGNTQAHGTGRRKQPASERALAGLDLQKRLPDARILYVSATAATEPSNMGYLVRLGLWGEGAALPKFESFLEQTLRGGLSMMEILARDMKAMGLYISRCLCFQGVEHERLHHQLTADQIDIYNELARAWQVAHRAMENDLQSDKGDPRKKDLEQLFWGAHQRFFNQVLISMQMPTVLKAIEKDLADGNAVVVQLVNHYEAELDRQVEGITSDEELMRLDLTPRRTLIETIQNGYPVHVMEEVADEEGNVRLQVLLDKAGDPVVDPDKVGRRDALIERFASIRVPTAPLDAIINKFGTDKVAEVTGRSQRVVRDPVTGKLKKEKLSPGARKAEVAEFQGDRKRILVFSGAGSTGASYHADRAAKNQRPRRHYLVQAGWRADEAVQGLGRTHRSNQAHVPFYRLCTTSIPGHKRFVSSIARRLDQLGALTRGQRQTGGQGMFDQLKDNLEGPLARAALAEFWERLIARRLGGVSVGEFEEQTGLTVTTKERTGRQAALPGITSFLNRLLSLTTEMQDGVWQAFEGIFDGVIEEARTAGTLDIGLEDVVGTRIEKAREQLVHTDKESGAETNYVEFKVWAPPERISWEQAEQELRGQKSPSAGFWINQASGRIWLAAEAGSVTQEDGTVEERFYMQNPVSPAGHHVALSELIGNPNWKPIRSTREARDLWQKELGGLPELQSRSVHLITGAILPIFDRLPFQGYARRALTDEGESLLGLQIPQEALQDTLRRMGVTAEVPEWTPAEALDQVLNGAILELGDGMKIQRATISGERRIELLDYDYRRMDELKRIGAFAEIHGYKTRLFIPNDDPQVYAKLIERRPVTGVTYVPTGGRGGSARGDFPPGPEQLRALGPLTREQRQWVNKRLEAGEPYMGIGAMLATPPDARGPVAKIYDAISERLQNITPDSAAGKLVRGFGRQLYGGKWGLDPAVWRAFQKPKGAKALSEHDAAKLNRQITRQMAALEKIGVDNVAYWRKLEDAIRGKMSPDELDPVSRRVYERAKTLVNELTDEFLEREDLHPYAVAFGLENLVDIIRQRRQAPGFYLRRLYNIAKEQTYRVPTAEEFRNVGPRIRGGMFMYKRSDEQLWTVRKADGVHRQFDDPDTAAAFFEAEIEANKQRYGDSVYERVRLIDPIGDDVMFGQLQPVRDVRELLARTLIDWRVNLETLKLAKYLADTVVDANQAGTPGWVQLGSHRSLGPLAGKWVPEAAAYNVMAVEKVRTAWFSQLYGVFNSMWKWSKVVASPATWCRNVLGLNYFWIVGGIHPVTDLGCFIRAGREWFNGGPLFRELLLNNVLKTGFGREIAGEFYKSLEADPSKPLLVAVGEGMKKWAKVGAAMGGVYDFPDQLTKLAAYIKYIDQGMSKADAVERVNDCFPNYEELGNFAKWARRSPLGAPFTAFVDQSLKITIAASRDRWGRLLAMLAFPGVLTLISSIILGLDDDDLELLNSGRNRRLTLDRYFQPLLPWADKAGRPQTLDLRWIMPLANDFRVETGPGGIGIPYLFSQPLTKTAIEIGWNRSQWTGRNIADPEAPIAERFTEYLGYAAQELAPVPTLATRGVGNILRAADSGEEGAVLKAILKELFGINIRAPRVSRDDALQLLKQKGLDGDWPTVVELLRKWNELYRPRGEKPISAATVGSSVRQAKRKQLLPTGS